MLISNMDSGIKLKAKRNPKEKRKGWRSGCTFAATLAAILMFLLLVVLIKSPIIDRPFPPTAIIVNPTSEVVPSPISVIATPPVGLHGRIFYVTANNKGINVYSMAADGSDRNLFLDQNNFDYSSPKGIYIPPGLALGQSSAGYIVVYNYFTGANSFYLINVSSAARLRLVDDSGIVSQPAISPDGKRIAYVGSPDLRTKSQIYVMDSDGANKHNLSRSSSMDSSPSWMPDSAHIRFISDRDGSLEYYVMNAEGTDVHKIAFNKSPGVLGIVWSPDGKYMAYSRIENGQRSLFIANADGSDAHALQTADAKFQDFRPSTWGNDSKSIIFIAKSEPLLVTPEPSWSMDGLWMINADGTNLHRLLDDHYVVQAVWVP